jgi:hypothetical protein
VPHPAHYANGLVISAPGSATSPRLAEFYLPEHDIIPETRSYAWDIPASDPHDSIPSSVSHCPVDGLAVTLSSATPNSAGPSREHHSNPGRSSAWDIPASDPHDSIPSSVSHCPVDGLAVTLSSATPNSAGPSREPHSNPGPSRDPYSDSSLPDAAQIALSVRDALMPFLSQYQQDIRGVHRNLREMTDMIDNRISAPHHRRDTSSAAHRPGNNELSDDEGMEVSDNEDEIPNFSRRKRKTKGDLNSFHVSSDYFLIYIN